MSDGMQIAVAAIAICVVSAVIIGWAYGEIAKGIKDI